MKIFISADIEGIAGIVDFNETDKSKPEYELYAEQMAKEVAAACEAANKAGAMEIWVKDAHDTGKNININSLPENVKLIRSWSGHPYLMMEEINNTFDAALMVGYHSGGSMAGNPLSHTLMRILNYVKINGRLADEFLINTYTAASVNVPVVFLSGDNQLCQNVRQYNTNIRTVSSNDGIGGSVVSIHPQIVLDKIRKGVEESLKDDIAKCAINLPERFEVEIKFNSHILAYKASFYPGMRSLDSTRVFYETEDYFDVLRMFRFII